MTVGEQSWLSRQVGNGHCSDFIGSADLMGGFGLPSIFMLGFYLPELLHWPCKSKGSHPLLPREKQ
jgi:hypothetical protein